MHFSFCFSLVDDKISFRKLWPIYHNESSQTAMNNYLFKIQTLFSMKSFKVQAENEHISGFLEIVCQTTFTTIIFFLFLFSVPWYFTLHFFEFCCLCQSSSRGKSWKICYQLYINSLCFGQKWNFLKNDRGKVGHTVNNWWWIWANTNYQFDYTRIDVYKTFIFSVFLYAHLFM